MLDGFEEGINGEKGEKNDVMCESGTAAATAAHKKNGVE